MGQMAYAQAPISTHPSVVLVLKLVSATHVKPVTGIVLSSDGLVLVPAEFISDMESSPGTEIVVLDGGGDIFSHGRPATIKQASLPGGLAILDVKGLGRPGITLAQSAPAKDGVFHLAAFPPAESIARGDDPLWVAARIIIDEATGTLTISAETILPNVSGAIIDDCGYLAGLSIANGVQSLETGQNPTTRFYEELKRAFESAQIKLPESACVNSAASQEAGTRLAKNSRHNDDLAQPASEISAVAALQEAAEAEPVEQAAGAAVKIPGANATESIANNAVIEPQPASPPSLWRSIPWWVLLAGLITLAILAWKIIFFLRLQNQSANPQAAMTIQPASDEPDTTRLQVAVPEPTSKPRSGRDDATELPSWSQLPEGCDAFVVLQGVFDEDTSFSGYYAVRHNQFDIIIGRGNADIRIEHPAISRSHARLKNEDDSMTLSDLGSSNGTYIGAVPCLPGDIMYVQPGDQVFLGDVGFYIRIISKESDLQ
jgi:hypothetical protein